MDELKTALHCMKVLAEIEVCEECSEYGNCDHTKQSDIARTCISTLEKHIPKKPIFQHRESVVHYDYADGHGKSKVERYADWTCPVCGWFVGEQYVPRKHNQQKSNFCSRCGQAIDWNTED